MPRKGYRKEPHHRRTRHVSTYLTDAEHEAFSVRLQLSGLTKAAYVRSALTGVAPRARPGAVRRELIREINRIGVNLNQLTRHANTDGMSPPLADRLDGILADIQNILPRIVRE